MSKQYKRLKCKYCNILLERSYTNEYLNRNYPVDISRPDHKINMMFHRYSKRLWDCSKCGQRTELKRLTYALIILDNLRGNYIE